MSRRQDTALDQANAQMASIRDMVAALEVDYGRLEELREERDAYEVEADGLGEDWTTKFQADADELSDLEAAAGDCESQDDAIERIREDALSVEVRSGWHSAGESAEATEFRIVLCTGGPHVQIVGELSQGEPSRAWLEYSDWGTGLTERVNQPGDQSCLVRYASQFYFAD